MSHNHRFEFNSGDIKRLPVVWNGKEINLAMKGQDLEPGFFGLVEAWQLFLEYENFVNNGLAGGNVR